MHQLFIYKMYLENEGRGGLKTFFGSNNESELLHERGETQTDDGGQVVGVVLYECYQVVI